MTDDVRYVLLADVVRSRDVEDREIFDERLEDALASANEAERESISTPLTHMKGVDEFGCVLERLSPVPDIVSRILDGIHPTYARFAVAEGDIDVGPDRETVARMDGQAFHRASELLEGLDDENLYVSVDTGRPADGLLASALNLLVIGREGLTERQIEVSLAYERHGTQSAASEVLGIPQQAVSDTLRRADHGRRRAIRRTLRESLVSIYD